MSNTRHIDRGAYFRKIKYAPHSAGQAAFHNSHARFKVACCGRRYGKTKMVAVDTEPELLLPDKWYWIVGPTYTLAEKEFRVMYNDFVFNLGLKDAKGLERHYNPRTGEMSMTLPWNTTLEVKSADKPQNLVGEGLDGVIMSEAAKHNRETWERFIQPALSDKLGWAKFVSTPEGMNYFHELWQIGQRPDEPQYESWQFPSWENPIVFPGGRQDPEILRIERNTTPEWFAQEFGAEFTAFVGKILTQWQEKLHVREVPFRPEWPSYGTFDWGYTNPLAFIEFQICPTDDSWHIWREHYLSFHTLEEHIEMIKARENPEGYHLDMCFGDAADPGAVDTVSRHLAPCFADPMAKKDWRRGIELLSSFMKPLPGGDPRYFVDYTLENTIREHNNYRSKKPSKEGHVPEMASNVEGHTIDGLRYAAVHLFDLGVNHHLNEIYNSVSDLESVGQSGMERGFFTR